MYCLVFEIICVIQQIICGNWIHLTLKLFVFSRRKLKRSVRSICYVMNEEELLQIAKEFADGD